MDVDSEPKEPKRIEELWFDDGGLVIRAQSSLFRVSRAILAARSCVFKDMLSFPQPPESELIEGCPVVQLHDSADDMTVFLRAIFDSEFFMPYPAPTSFDIIAGILRLSNKYAVEYLRRRALVHLSSAYPTTLSAYDESTSSDASHLVRPSWIDETAFPEFAVIKLSLEVDAPWILPSSFYYAAIEEDGPELIKEALVCNFADKRTPKLDSAYHSAFLKGYLQQRESAMTEILRFLYHPLTIESCTGGSICIITRLGAFEDVRNNLLKYPSIPLSIWGSGDWGRLSGACLTCRSALRRTHREARQSFWAKLPAMYGLPGWEELEKMKAAAIGSDLIR
ncbi:hypothetical protein B0H10DRAFT_1774531 [Mycena sp. CBHHK59/15]|nr:hypothetical protein B0H10DRAFT_1774531 [Mycena sp. CBHHK59/15]